ncbi:hypothetical protein [Kitasatospora sp. NPDC093679]|uniref:hypothetical protein n=1 Tax=Kitasatospora sp. NPDC093679 TaxID=3154983 RepID=UPI00342D1524
MPADVTYTGVSLGDTTDGVAAAVPGTFGKVFATFRKRPPPPSGRPGEHHRRDGPRTSRPVPR